jgi:hypothetical protein
MLLLERRHTLLTLPTLLFSLWIALGMVASAQQPEEVPGLEDLDSIPASSGYHTSTCRIVYLDSLGIGGDSMVTSLSRFDERGRIVEKIGYSGTEEEEYREKWEYDERSGLVRRSWKYKSEEGEPIADWWYTHDAAGRLIRAADSVTKVAADYRYANGGAGAPCLAIIVTGRYRYSGIDTYCDSLGRIVRQYGYIGGSDTVVAITDHPASGRRRRTVYSDGNRRIRQWTYLSADAGHILEEEYRTGTPESTEPLYTIKRTFDNGLLRRKECDNYGAGDWVEYYEYR